MTRRTGRKKRCRLGRLALILGVLWLLGSVAMCLTFKEYGKSAVVRVEPDSLASALCHYLRSPLVAKGGAISAMKGDYSRLLVSSLSDGKVSRELASWNPETSVRAMRKMIAWNRNGNIHLSYFSTDSVSTERTFSYYVDKLKAAAGNTASVEVLGKEACPLTLPWRSSAALALVLLALWLLAFVISRIFFPRRKTGLTSLEDFSSAIGSESVLLGAVEEIPSGREKYSNAQRWKAQAESIAEKIKSFVPQTGALVNILGMSASAIYKFKRTGCLSALMGGAAVNIMEDGQDMDSSSTAYRFPDIARLKEDNSGNLLVMVHPSLAESGVPAAYLENAALNVLVSDAPDGWTEAHRAFLDSIPSCKVVLTGMESKGGGKKLRAYIPSEKRWRFIVLLSECWSDSLRETTCRSLAQAAWGDSSEKPVAEEEGAPMEVSSLGVDYKVAAFRKSSRVILDNLDFSSGDADAVIMLKAGCRVGKNFFSDISSALYAGQECLQCRVVEKGHTLRPEKGELLKYGYVLTRYALKSEYFCDYLSRTIVNFS